MSNISDKWCEMSFLAVKDLKWKVLQFIKYQMKGPICKKSFFLRLMPNSLNNDAGTVGGGFDELGDSKINSSYK